MHASRDHSRLSGRLAGADGMRKTQVSPRGVNCTVGVSSGHRNRISTRYRLMMSACRSQPSEITTVGCG
jgi:hypothetical protein